MKKYILFAAASLVLVACGSQEDLKSLQKKESEIQAEIQKLSDSLSGIQKRITALKDANDSNVAVYPLVTLTAAEKNPFIHT
ncbi:MAG: hypothetical protein LPK45_07925, partial [Bacteroidota bacterium]|nr:hypothetical protein [Bacteroidota bacterium]MDX5430998.1 hypothetical protein [Bacteroidota bacterium]MDX5469749.1 hypothetical protein [Bacteroidota bacterium]